MIFFFFSKWDCSCSQLLLHSVLPLWNCFFWVSLLGFQLLIMVPILPWIPAKQAIDFREVAWNSKEHLAECFVAKFQWLNKSACSFDMFINETHRSNFQRSMKQLSWVKWPAHLEKNPELPMQIIWLYAICQCVHTNTFI